uniref:testis-expressed protein 22 isoform X2 n=1 Tax=Panthera onca TaxID=9690 RepID=UPI0029559685|nr:testis-expressed protein 22 isoform X2 [Panthera onca]
MVPPPDLLRCALLTPALIPPLSPLRGARRAPGGERASLGVWSGRSQGSPGGADKLAEGLDMDSRKHLANASLGKKSGLPLPQELGQPPPPVSATTAWGQPGAQSGGQQVLQTQDWFFKASKTHILRRLEGMPVARMPFPTRVHGEALHSSRRAVSRTGFLNFLLCNLVCGFFLTFQRLKLHLHRTGVHPGSLLVSKCASRRRAGARATAGASASTSAGDWPCRAAGRGRGPPGPPPTPGFTEVFLRPLDPHQSWPGTLPVLGDTVFPSGLGLPALSVTAEMVSSLCPISNLTSCPVLFQTHSRML